MEFSLAQIGYLAGKSGGAAAGLEGVAGGNRIGLENDGTHGWRPFKRLASGWTILGNPPVEPSNRPILPPKLRAWEASGRRDPRGARVSQSTVLESNPRL